MIKSMTGFGQAIQNQGEANITVEVKSLNSKFLDLNLRLPRQFSEKELEIRNLVADNLERGKVSLSIEYQKTARQENRQTYNEDLFVAYYNDLRKLADKVMAPSYDYIFQLALTSPDVIQGNGKEELPASEWERVQQLLAEAMKKCDQFRAAEGKVLEEKLASYIHSIARGLQEVEVLDPKRVERVRNKIKTSVVEFFGN
ncbi:MAG: YicC/YloC family endoribonuclease, partial [Bacteroidota bacterium]